MLFAAARRRESQSQSEFHALESDLAVASDKSISSLERMAMQVELLDRRSVRTASSLTMARSAWHSKDAKNSR